MQVRNDLGELGERLKVVEGDKLALDTAISEIKKEIEGKKVEPCTPSSPLDPALPQPSIPHPCT